MILRLQTNTIISEITLEKQKSIFLGRSEWSDYKIPDDLVSSKHCQIVLLPSKLEIIDLSSKNGTYLNGLRIEQAEIFIGDEIKIGATKITIASDKMDFSSTSALTFSGAAKDRQSYGLELDFAGTKMLNQSLPSSSPSSSSIELEVRKPIQNKIILSKQEIKLRNKKRDSLAFTVDTILIFLMTAFPLLVFNLSILLIPEFIQKHRLLYLFSSVIACVGLFFILNFKLLKFTIGEKISGIQKLYQNQEL